MTHKNIDRKNGVSYLSSCALALVNYFFCHPPPTQNAHKYKRDPMFSVLSKYYSSLFPPLWNTNILYALHTQKSSGNAWFHWQRAQAHIRSSAKFRWCTVLDRNSRSRSIVDRTSILKIRGTHLRSNFRFPSSLSSNGVPYMSSQTTHQRWLFNVMNYTLCRYSFTTRTILICCSPQRGSCQNNKFQTQSRWSLARADPT